MYCICSGDVEKKTFLECSPDFHFMLLIFAEYFCIVGRKQCDKIVHGISVCYLFLMNVFKKHILQI